MYERNYHSRLLKSDKVAEEKKQKRPFPWSTFFWILGIVFFISAVVYLIKVPQFQIKEVFVQGAVVEDKDEISNLVKNELEGKYLSFLPKTSILLANPKSLAKSIHSKYPRIKNVEVLRNTLDSLLVNITEYEGKYLWCDTSKCSFMSEDGVVFADAPYFSGDAYLKIFIGKGAQYPFTAIDQNELGVVSEISSKLHDINIDLTEFHFVSEYKLDLVFVHNSVNTHIYIDPTRNIDNALEVLYTGLKTNPLSDMYKDSNKILEYLDLRFSDKVVYKFQQ
jgi:hypothetical protein